MLNNLKKFSLTRSKDFLFLLLNKGILFAFPFILIPLIIKNVGLNSYGQYITAQSVGLFISSFIMLGFEVYGIKKITDIISKKFKIKKYNLFLSITDEKDYSIAFTVLQSQK